MPNHTTPELANRHTGPAFGFVKLRFGNRRTPDVVSEITMKWSKVVKTGAIEAKFMGRFRGLKEFVFDQPEAYEIKIGDQVFRRPRDPPLDEAIQKLQAERSEKSGGDSKEEL